MTTPEADAFVRQLDQDPELLERVRARILTRELLQLPETVARLASIQQETAEQLASFQQQTTEQINALQEAQQQTNERLDNLQEAQQQTNERLDNLEKAQQHTNERLDTLTGSVQRIEGTLGNLTGSAYENRAARIAPRLLARYLRMRRAQVIQAPNANTRAHLDDMVNESVIDGAISDQQAQELERADIIVTAEDNEDQTVYVIIEASVTIDDTDIDRAHERALIMGRLTSTAVRAAVIGQDISPSKRQRADGLGVTFMPLSQ